MTVKELRQKLFSVQEQDAEIEIRTVLDQNYPDKTEWECSIVSSRPIDNKIIIFGV